MSVMPEIEIISATTCPFAQRTRMVLIEKNIEHELSEIDLDDKPDWFWEISPYGKVPVIRHKGTTFYESAVINEYLEEAFPEHNLMPQTPEMRAQARVWIDFANVRFVPHIYKVLLAQDEEGQALHERKIYEALKFMEFEGLRKLGDGPYWLGEEISLVDITFFPHLERFVALEHYRGITIPQDHTRLHAWLGHMKQRPSVRQTTRDEETYKASWLKYASNSSTGTTARDMRES
jgi:glutathione S-transferase